TVEIAYTAFMNHSVELADGTRLPILIRKHRSARRMVIRYHPLKAAIGLTLPRYASVRQGLRFVDEKRGWIEKQLHEKSGRIPFAGGQTIPVLGKTYTLKHVGGRGVVTAQGDEILVAGAEDFMARRVREWLKKQAEKEIRTLAAHKSALVGVRVRKISLRDTHSRWGSCSHDGNLSFSWRLVFAPYEVLEYLVSHEVAHLKEHNHSAAFWAVVEELFPEYRKAERWLKAHGRGLYQYG
ncbi:MAG: M48 family metallopeptidase, partial [Pseudomonadota bacterium]|nr:M48 family metallopeptidase [Pseudomonadota bacterium]